MFKKLTPFEHHKSFMPFDYLFMTKEQYEEFMKTTKPADEPIITKVIQEEYNIPDKPIFYIDKKFQNIRLD
jgi:hypothetical protein